MFIMCGILYVIPSLIIIFTSCIKYASVSIQFLVILEFFCSRLCLVSLVFKVVYLLSQYLLPPFCLLSWSCPCVCGVVLFLWLEFYFLYFL